MKNKILNHWDNNNSQSMYDKNLLKLEIDAMLKYIPKNSDSKILDAGCGEGEGTYEYSLHCDGEILGVDFSKTRLNKAKKRLSKRKNVRFRQIDLLKKFYFLEKFDIIINQRVLINLKSWDNQKKTINKLSKYIKKNGLYILLEGSNDGVEQLNKIRKIFGLKPIPIKWHNVFIDDVKLEKYMEKLNFSLVKKESFSDYFLLTRVLRPVFDKNLDWDCDFNVKSAKLQKLSIINSNKNISRLKLWVYKKNR